MNWPNSSLSENFEATAKAECVIPFNYEGKIYNACTQDGHADHEFWCATSVADRLTNDGGYGMGWGYCTDSCPKVRKFQKEIVVSSILQKNQTDNFSNFCPGI